MFLILSAFDMRLAGLSHYALLASLLLSAASMAMADDAPATAAVILRIVDAGEHPWVRWNRFPDYQLSVRRVYEGTQIRPLWLDDDGRPTPQASEVITSLLEADAHGLAATDYDAERLRDEAQRLTAADEVSAEDSGLFDTALTVSVMRYISDAYIGRVNPRSVAFRYDVEPKKLDLPAVVTELARHPAPRQRLAGLDPPFPIFARLQQALAQYRALAARTDLPVLPELPKLRPGDSNAGLPALRVWLIAFGDLADSPDVVGKTSPRAAGAATLYDPALAAAVKRFQRRHGLDADAVIGRGTLRALQVPPADRVRQIQLAMERLRWLPYAFEDRFIVVNVPEFRLRAFQSGSPTATLTMPVVVGEAAVDGGAAPATHKTPLLHAYMTHLIFRPYWTVPTSIAEKEIFPKADRDPGYLPHHDMEVVHGRVRQKPGKNNSLGLVKFILPNPYHVYLHDTPSKALFARSRRDFSHGCIRVADPPTLAAFVLNGQRGWDSDRIKQAMTSGPDDRRVDLDDPVPVYLFYTTVVADDDGSIYFFDDIYGHDATLEAQLAGR